MTLCASKDINPYKLVGEYYGLQNMKKVIQINSLNQQILAYLHQKVMLKKRYSHRDWLSKRDEKGDPFSKYINSEKKNRVTASRQTIYILRMDHDISDECLELLKLYWAAFFHKIEIKIFDFTVDLTNDDNTYNITTRISKETQKIQYLATDILDLIQEKYLPNDAYCVIGIINQDLYPKPGWNFVFGCSRLKRRTGIFSFARYSWNLESKSKDDINKLMIYRACKTMTHEIGHMFGVRHWIYHEWLMNGSNKIQEADLKPLLLWPVCLRKFHYAIGFDIVGRYTEMRNVIQTYFNDNVYFSSTLDLLDEYINSFGLLTVDEDELEMSYSKFSSMFKKPIVIKSWNEYENLIPLELNRRDSGSSQALISNRDSQNLLKQAENNMVVLGMVKESPVKHKSSEHGPETKASDKMCECNWRWTIF